ncbi:unnamed protein product [Rhodiola kirilowii]
MAEKQRTARAKLVNSDLLVVPLRIRYYALKSDIGSTNPENFSQNCKNSEKALNRKRTKKNRTNNSPCVAPRQRRQNLTGVV